MEAIIFALSKGPTDWMNWRQVENIKAHMSNLIEKPYHIFKGAMTIFFGRAGAWKQLIPSAKSSNPWLYNAAIFRMLCYPLFIYPSFDCIVVDSEEVARKSGPVAIIANRLHHHLIPAHVSIFFI